jgi:outer membrane protein assembly factor BamB
VLNGTVYVGSTDGNLYALNATTGHERWAAPTAGIGASSPAVANGLVYMGDTGDHVDAFDASDGSRLWNFTIGSPINFSSAAVSNGLVTIGSDDGHVYAFGLAGGIPAVRRPAPAQLHPDGALRPRGGGFHGIS